MTNGAGELLDRIASVEAERAEYLRGLRATESERARLEKLVKVARGGGSLFI